jgi:hypothetical protein
VSGRVGWSTCGDFEDPVVLLVEGLDALHHVDGLQRGGLVDEDGLARADRHHFGIDFSTPDWRAYLS